MRFIRAAHMMPLLLGVSSAEFINNTDMLFSEDSVMKSFAIQNVEAYSANKNQEFVSSFYKEDKFYRLYNKWVAETEFKSNISDIINNYYFKGIISLGENAVPFILEEIDKKPSTLVWALNIIKNKKITNSSSATITEACKAWVKWGLSQKLL